MTVQELFKSLNKEEFINYYCYYDLSESDKYEITEKGKQVVTELFEQLLTAKPVENENGCIIFSIEQIGTEMLYSFLVHREDLLSSEEPEHYAYELSPMLEILGYDVSTACKHALGNDYRLAASILYEMTFFGYTIDSQEEETSDTLTSLNKSVQEIEEGTAELLTADEVFSNFGYEDTRTYFEREFDDDKYTIEGTYFVDMRTRLYKLEKEYLKK